MAILVDGCRIGGNGVIYDLAFLSVMAGLAKKAMDHCCLDVSDSGILYGRIYPQPTIWSLAARLDWGHRLDPTKSDISAG